MAKRQMGSMDEFNIMMDDTYTGLLVPSYSVSTVVGYTIYTS